MGAIPALSDNGLKKVAAQIGANEAQHLTTLKSVGAGGDLVPNPSLPEVLTAAEATAAVKPFLRAERSARSVDARTRAHGDAVRTREGLAVAGADRLGHPLAGRCRPRAGAGAARPRAPGGRTGRRSRRRRAGSA